MDLFSRQSTVFNFSLPIFNADKNIPPTPLPFQQEQAPGLDYAILFPFIYFVVTLLLLYLCFLCFPYR